MLLLRVTDSFGTVTQHLVQSFPYQIGRSAEADLRIDAPGVWERHATIFLAESGKFAIQSEGESFLLINSSPTRAVELSSGDEVSLGSVRVQVGLAPVAQRGLKLSETIVWILLGLVVVTEAVLLVFVS